MFTKFRNMNLFTKNFHHICDTCVVVFSLLHDKREQYCCNQIQLNSVLFLCGHRLYENHFPFNLIYQYDRNEVTHHMFDCCAHLKRLGSILHQTCHVFQIWIWYLEAEACFFKGTDVVEKWLRPTSILTYVWLAF